MFCQNCGNEIKEGIKFCPNCGNPLNIVNTQTKEKTPQTARLSHNSSIGVYEFLETLEPNLDFIWARSGNDIKAQFFLGILSAFAINTFILAFNTENIYICQLSKVSGQDIVNIKKYAWSEIKCFTASGATSGKMLKFVTKYGELKFRTQKIFSMENQGDRIEKLLKMQK